MLSSSPPIPGLTPARGRQCSERHTGRQLKAATGDVYFNMAPLSLPSNWLLVWGLKPSFQTWKNTDWVSLFATPHQSAPSFTWSLIGEIGFCPPFWKLTFLISVPHFTRLSWMSPDVLRSPCGMREGVVKWRTDCLHGLIPSPSL